MKFAISPRLLSLVLLGVLGTFTVMQAASHAAHADDWCYDDPVFSVNGRQTQVVVGVEGDAATVAAAGVVASITVIVPAGVSTSIIVPPGSGPFDETITFVTAGSYNGNGPVPVHIQTSFTSLSKLGASMQVTYAGGSTSTAYGNTNGVLNTLSLQFSE